MHDASSHPAWPLYSGVVSLFVPGDASLVADGGLATEPEADDIVAGRVLIAARGKDAAPGHQCHMPIRTGTPGEA